MKNLYEEWNSGGLFERIFELSRFPVRETIVIALKSAAPPLRAKILQQPNGCHERQHERKSQ